MPQLHRLMTLISASRIDDQPAEASKRAHTAEKRAAAAPTETRGGGCTAEKEGCSLLQRGEQAAPELPGFGCLSTHCLPAVGSLGCQKLASSRASLSLFNSTNGLTNTTRSNVSVSHISINLTRKIGSGTLQLCMQVYGVHHVGAFLSF